MNIFFDMEFTGLVQRTTPISIGIIPECGETFYAEFTDYDKLLLTDWVKHNVINKLQLKAMKEDTFDIIHGWRVKGRSNFVATCLKAYINSLSEEKDSIKVWSDCLSYDWVILNNLWGGALAKPHNIYYIPFDICTLMLAKGIDPDINREEFVGINNCSSKHNALWDAEIIKKCYDKLIKFGGWEYE